MYEFEEPVQILKNLLSTSRFKKEPYHWYKTFRLRKGSLDISKGSLGHQKYFLIAQRTICGTFLNNVYGLKPLS